MSRVFKDFEEQLIFDNIKATAEPRDTILASLLMTAAFHGSNAKELSIGIAPLYLIQAYNINRNMLPALRKLIA